MKASAFTHRKAQAGAKPCLAWRRAVKQAQVMGATAGLIGGGAAGTFGSALTAAGWFVANEGARHWLSTSGAVLLFLTIPLLIMSGFFMDWLEKDNPRRESKGARYEENDEEQ
jgi:hypothetical protein